MKALDKAFAKPIPTGAVYRLYRSEKDGLKAKLMKDSLYYANGITMDRNEDYLYVSEFRLDRILRYELDRENDTLIDERQYATILSPDNLETDEEGNLWVASLLQNKILAIDRENQSVHTVFSATSPMNSSKQKEWVLKTHLGKSVEDIGHPDMWDPLNAPLTGVFWSYDKQQVYFTGLGDNILKYDYE